MVAQDTPSSQQTTAAPALPEECYNTDSRRDGEPQEKNSNQRYDLPDLRRRINNRITTTRRCLAEITSPFKSPIQKHMHGEYIKRIQELTQQANKDISDIETNHRKDIPSTELESLKKSLSYIKDEVSTANKNLRAWEVLQPRPPIFSQEGIIPLTSNLHRSHAQDNGYPLISTTDTITTPLSKFGEEYTTPLMTPVHLPRARTPTTVSVKLSSQHDLTTAKI